MIFRRYKSFFTLVIGFLFTLPVFSQTLTISSAGNSGSYSYSPGTLTLSGNATITAVQIVTWLNSSSLTILGTSNAISVDVNEDINSTVAGNGLTIGNTNSTGTVTFNNTVSLMGPLTVYANNIRMGSTVVANGQSAQLLAGGSLGSISLYAKNGFETLAVSGTTRGKIMTTGGGSIHINADTEANNAGQLNIDWLTFDSGTGNIILEASSYSWSTSSSVELPEFYGTGAFTFRNVPNATHIFSLSWIAIFQNRSELTLGSNTGSEEIQLAPCTVCHFSAKNYTGATLEVNGPINLYGSKVTVDLSIKSALANADILLKAKNSITVNASRSITSNNGDITLWANSDGTANATDGDFIGLQNAVVINSANGATNQAAGGGTITMAGGTTTQNLASGTTVPTGYAYSNRTTNWGPLLPPGGVNFGFSTAANGQQNSLSIYSGGGDIVIKGKSHSSSAGIQWFSGMPGASQIINSGNGTILFDGLATSSNAHGIELNSYVSSGGVTPNITSSSSSSTAIRFIGETSATIDRSGFQGAATLIANATSGGIEISGKTPSASTYGAVEAGGIQTYALTGPITFIGDGSGGLKIGGTWGKGSLPSSSSNIVLRSNAFTFANPTIQTTGTITIEPLGNSFTNAISFPITGLSLPNTITGLTLGKTENTTNITFASATSVTGPITVYGGALTLSGALSTTNTTTGNMSLNGTTLSGGSLSVADGRTLTMNLSANTDYSGTISGSNLHFVKNGSGILSFTTPTALSFAKMRISGGTFRLNSNQQLTLTDTLINNGIFIMKDNATFVQATTGTSVAGSGTFTVEKALSGNAAWSSTTGRFWYMGVPMITVARNSFGNYNANANRLWSYDESTKQYTDITSDNTTLSAGTGYVHRRTTDGTLTFSSTGANGLVRTNQSLGGLTRTSGSSVGFNLISNPYMAYLDWDAVLDNTNTGTSNIEPTYYIRSAASGNISALITFNGSTNALVNTSGITVSAEQMNFIAPLQAIWVRVGTAASTGSLAMTRSMLSHQGNNPGLKNTTVFPTLARVNLLDGPRFDQMLVFMNQDLSNTVDAYDSEKMFVSGTPQIYTMAAGKKLVMNGLNSNKKKISVPLYLELPTSKVYELQLAEYLLEDGIILLEDKQEGTIQDFTIHDTYAFYANSGVLSNRFVLHFFMPDATITAQGPSNSWVEDETSYTEGGSVQITADAKGKVQISLDQPETDKVEGTVQATDANGRVVYSGVLEGLTTEFQLNVPSGIYYLTVQNGFLIENKKVFIHD
jgi:hypothetical protein